MEVGIDIFVDFVDILFGFSGVVFFRAADGFDFDHGKGFEFRELLLICMCEKNRKAKRPKGKKKNSLETTNLWTERQI